ncbi:MAG: hypothetical protein Q9159_005961 [Coniocarpon cinnabarinum]
MVGVGEGGDGQDGSGVSVKSGTGNGPRAKHVGEESTNAVTIGAAAHFPHPSSAGPIQLPTTSSSSPQTASKTLREFRSSASSSPGASRDPVPPGYRSPKRPTRDIGTQYTPPAPPSTEHPSIINAPAKSEPGHPVVGDTQAIIADSQSLSATSAASACPPETPPAPQVRETPRSTLTISKAQNSRPVASSASSTTHASPKKRKKTGEEVKVLPSDYAQCEPKTLAVLIASLIMDLIGHNDNIQLEEVHLTRFHSRTPPGISVHDYMQRLTFHATLPTPVLLAMVNYIDKLCEAFSIFTINSLTVHRFLIAAATVAAKGLCDVFWTNSTYAKVGGVSKKELAILELELLSKIEWRIVPNPEKLGEYYKSLVDNHPSYILSGPNSSGTPSSQSSDSIGTDTMNTD